MSHTFESHSTQYWLRVFGLVIGLATVAILPSYLPTTSSPVVSQVFIAIFAVIALIVGIFARPKQFTVSVSDTEVVVTCSSMRVLFSSPIRQLELVALGRWGQILGHPVGGICLKTTSSKKALHIGAISMCKLLPESHTELTENLLVAKERA